MCLQEHVSDSHTWKYIYILLKILFMAWCCTSHSMISVVVDSATFVCAGSCIGLHECV